ncbi:helix-turn-helix transcriptional regulator [Virgibacillus salexigens]|uniref:helix-turn-helix transcriptional regulator n=1 Tax=Virgibacillus salexigens TaxID=61016 RepID=UPI003081C53F
MQNRIREIRLQKKLSGTKMAKELGISPQYFYDIEKGERNLSVELATKISSILGVTINEVLGEEVSSEISEYNYHERDINTKILDSLKRLTDDEGYFYDDTKKDAFLLIAESLYMAPAYHEATEDEYYASLIKERSKNNYKLDDDVISELDKAYNYNTVKMVLDSHHIEEKDSFLEGLKEIIAKHSIPMSEETPYSYGAEKEFINKLELSDAKLLKQFDLELDGRKLTEEEAKGVIAYLRSLRQFD